MGTECDLIFLFEKILKKLEAFPGGCCCAACSLCGSVAGGNCGADADGGCFDDGGGEGDGLLILV